jgi:ketosteroid isomerase-like protein
MCHFSLVKHVQSLVLVLGLAAAGLGGVGCAASGSASSTGKATSVDRAAVAKALIQIDEAWSEAASTRDAKKVAAFMAEDGVVYPPNTPAVPGRDAVEKMWAGYFAEPSLKIGWKVLRADVAASGDLGYTSGSYELSMKLPDGNMYNEKGKYLCVWAPQKDGTWKATHDMWNSDTK